MKFEAVTFAVLLALLTVTGLLNHDNATNRHITHTASVFRRARNAAAAHVVQPVKRAKAMECSNNLRQIYTSIKVFELDNNRFPAPDGVNGLKELSTQQHVPQALFCCPQRRPAKLTEKSVSFLYLGKTATAAGGKNFPLIIEKPGPHGNTASVLFADGSVRTINVPGKYTSVKQVIPMIVPQAHRAAYTVAVEKLEKAE